MSVWIFISFNYSPKRLLATSFCFLGALEKAYVNLFMELKIPIFFLLLGILKSTVYLCVYNVCK